MAKWVMTSKRQDGGVVFWIGQIRVANLVFVGDGSKRVFLRTFDGPVLGPYENMSEGMKEMHRRLSTPPVE